MRSAQPRNPAPQTPARPGFVVSGIPKIRSSTGSASADGTASQPTFERVQISHPSLCMLSRIVSSAPIRDSFERVQTAPHLDLKCTPDTPVEGLRHGPFERVQKPVADLVPASPPVFLPVPLREPTPQSAGTPGKGTAAVRSGAHVTALSPRTSLAGPARSFERVQMAHRPRRPLATHPTPGGTPMHLPK